MISTPVKVLFLEGVILQGDGLCDSRNGVAIDIEWFVAAWDGEAEGFGVGGVATEATGVAAHLNVGIRMLALPPLNGSVRRIVVCVEGRLRGFVFPGQS